MVVRQSSIANRNDFLINCPSCSRICKIEPEDLEKSDRLVKIFGMDGLYIYQCACGTRFNMKLDFRRKQRHGCSISSHYLPLAQSDYGTRPDPDRQNLYQSKINSVIKDISVDGIGLLVFGRHEIKPEDELLVAFTLRKGNKEELLERRVVVRTVRGNYIGGEFFSADKKKPDIGFFLLPV